ncbi:MAG: ABC-2 family transporter protein [Planctomycetota bacterium]|jgi:ABC-2 type transport system permease protein|nr:ABC-2 family transporter protein [Planctomycetota bacterium]
MRATLRKANTYLSVQYAAMLEYRMEIFLWAISTLLPLIMMGPWIVAGESGRFPMDAAGFARYFIAAFIVRQFTLTWVIYEFEFQVVSGRLSPYLLHPVDPVWRFVAAHLGEHLARLPFVIALIAAALALFPQALYDSGGGLWLPPMERIILTIFGIYGAFTLRFVIQYSLALLAFWFERVSAFDRLVMIPYYFISGLIAPLEVMPEEVQAVILWTPFPYMVWFPARLLSGGGGLDPWRGFAVVGLWIVGLTLLNRLLWRRGLKHYSAMGA